MDAPPQTPSSADFKERRVTASLEDDGRRLDAVLSKHLGDLSRTRLKALIEQGLVASGNGPITSPSQRVSAGEELVVRVPPAAPAVPEPEDIALDILHEDDALIVLNKPAGLVVHPGAGQPSGTLVNAVLYHARGQLSGIGGIARPGIVHRLDKDTSGVMVVAKTDHAHQSLSAQFADHGRTGGLRRAYRAIVWGAPKRTSMRVETGIGRDPSHPTRMAVRPDGKPSVTQIDLCETLPDAETLVASVVQCRLETGRTHQIRVHCTHIGHPLLGDPLYGTGFRSKRAKLSERAATALTALNRQALHAEMLAFQHPASGQVMDFHAPLPEDMETLVQALRAG